MENINYIVFITIPEWKIIINMFNDFDLKSFIATLPNLPGIYKYLNKMGEIIYIGKACNLKKRVASYFHKKIMNPRIARMVKKIVKIDITVTPSEIEAFILEKNLIKHHLPRYNILFRDDKSYPYVLISKHNCPRIAYYRGNINNTNAHYFGPFPNAWAARETIHVIQKIFRLRTCKDSVFINRSRPCMLYQIKSCSAPCVNIINNKDYDIDVQNAIQFLKGEKNSVVSELKKNMQIAADSLEFESAALIQDQIVAISKILHKQTMENIGCKDTDIIAIASINNISCINLAMVRNGQHLGDKVIYPETFSGKEQHKILEDFIIQQYRFNPIPNILVLSHSLSNLDINFIKSKKNNADQMKSVQILTNPKGIMYSWLEQAKKNAELSLKQSLRTLKLCTSQTFALSRFLKFITKQNIPDNLYIECFDISHASGEATQASCVVFKNYLMQHSLYRRYNITGIKPGDDYNAIRQVIYRRFTKLIQDKEDIPNVVLIDGGKGQIKVVNEVLSELNLNIQVLIGIAKGEKKKNKPEKLVFSDNKPSIVLDSELPVSVLLMKIRDEAHRFALSGMKNRLAKTRNFSQLENIYGIGIHRRQHLLRKFGCIDNIASANIDELTTVKGISQSLAMRILNSLK